jgi:hypothetical protein
MKKYIKKIVGCLIIGGLLLTPYIMIALQGGIIKACISFFIVMGVIALLILGIWLVAE